MPHLSTARYGKDLVRVFRIVRNPSGVHDIVEYTVCCLLEGEIEQAWTKSDNRCIVATDSIKNITYYYAKTSPHVLCPEKFALELGLHFVNEYAHINKSFVDITSHKWSRIPVDGKPHKHSFTRDGEEKRLTTVVVDATQGKKNISATVKSGVKELLVLKSTGSSFEDYVFDKFTTLAPVDDRIFSTAVDCQYTVTLPGGHLTKESIASMPVDFDTIYSSMLHHTFKTFATHDSASVQATLYLMCEAILQDNAQVRDISYKLPNKHYFAVDQSYIGIKNTAPQDAEVFMPVAHPSGLIIATVVRDGAKL